MQSVDQQAKQLLGQASSETIDATLQLGTKLSAIASQSNLFTLSGPLGAGKTVLARGFVRRLCGEIEVVSPTFNLVQSYVPKKLGCPLYHLDLYRLKNPAEVWELGLEDMLDEGICLIEWPERAGVLDHFQPLEIILQPVLRPSIEEKAEHRTHQMHRSVNISFYGSSNWKKE